MQAVLVCDGERCAMLVFWKQGLVFLSVPKTGTTAWEEALAPHASIAVLDPPDLKHAPLYRYNRFFRPMFEKVGQGNPVETLAVVREPVSWLGSWYRFRRRPFMQGKKNATFDISFDEFVTGYMQGNPPDYANVGSQARFLEPRPNGTAIDHLFRYEDQAGLLAFLENRLGLRIELPRSNVSPAMDLTLSAEVERRLRRKCAEEFALWDSIPLRGA